LQPQTDDDDSEKNVEFAGGNVHLIATKESWDQKMAEASRDGKIVSFTSLFIFCRKGESCGMMYGASLSFMSCLFAEVILIFPHGLCVTIFVNLVRLYSEVLP
jgi:hypothetical protein